MVRLVLAGLAFCALPVSGVGARNLTPLGIAIEGWPYPYAVHMFPVVERGQHLRMACMDFPPTAAATGRTAVMLHGKDCSSDYGTDVISDLTRLGYRVVVPDQMGSNTSPKPDLDHPFDGLTADTVAQPDHLGMAGPVDVVVHSTGGTLAVRLALTHPERVRGLVLEDPIGPEDHRVGIPPQTTETLTAAELGQTAGSYRTFTARHLIVDPRKGRSRSSIGRCGSPSRANTSAGPRRRPSPSRWSMGSRCGRNTAISPRRC